MKKIFALAAVFLGLLAMAYAQPADAQSKFGKITLRFVDALTLAPLGGSQITVSYDENDDGNLSAEEVYMTGVNGDVSVPAKGKVLLFRSDKADNISYLKSGGSIVLESLESPVYTVYLSPIFDIRVKLDTDFNFLLSFFRMFRLSSHLEASVFSEFNTGSQTEPGCFTSMMKKGKTINQYSNTYDVRAYFSRDLNSPTKDPYVCSVYAWESVRGVGGIQKIDFTSLDMGKLNEISLPLNMTYDAVVSQYPNIKP